MILPSRHMAHKEHYLTIQATVLRKKEAATICGISVATLDRMRLSGDFIKPIQLGERAIGFLRKDVDDWITSRLVLES